MKTEVIIGIGGLLLAVLTYFAGVWRTERRLSKEDREKRIQRVFQKYMGFRNSNYTGGFDGLQKAGIATLANNDEINELFDLIIAHGEKHPLGKKQLHLFETVDLKSFFDFTAKRRINFLQISIEKIIEDFRQKA
jgi:hypothetical protein